MQEPHLSRNPATELDDTKHAPLHEDIVQCAQDLWVEYGRPADRDLEIWLKAEQRLFSAAQAPHGKNPGPTTKQARLPAKPARY